MLNRVFWLMMYVAMVAYVEVSGRDVALHVRAPAHGPR